MVNEAMVPVMRMLAQFVVVPAAPLQPARGGEPTVALARRRLFGGRYIFLIFLIVRRALDPPRQACVLEANRDRYKIVHEAMGWVKDVKMLGVEDSFTRPVPRPPRRVAPWSSHGHAVVGEAPRSILQAWRLPAWWS